MIKDLWLILPEDKGQEEFLKTINRPDNFFKHAESDPEGEISFDPRGSEVLLGEACEAYARIAGERPPLLATFVLWFKFLIARRFPERAKEIWIDDPASFERLEALRTLTRGEFFEAVSSFADQVAMMWPTDTAGIWPRPPGVPRRRDRKRRSKRG